MKAIILLAILAVAAARPEAPLHGGYRNGQRRTNGFSQGFQGATRAIFRNGGAPSPRYGPPTNGRNGQQNGANGAQNGGNGLQNGANGLSGDLGDDFTPPAAINGAPAPAFVPATTNGNGHRNGNGHANGNGHRNGNGLRNGNGHRNGNGNGHRNGNGNGAPAGTYGPPGFASGNPIGANEDPLAEPASYQFSYKVEDAEAGLNFGHEEAREGDEATGEYFVLLPDGRTLRVTYVANNDGYQPEITFEEPKNGGNRNGNGFY